MAHRHQRGARTPRGTALRTRSASALASLAWLAWSGLAHAAHPLITEDAATQGTGKYQVEVNSEFSRDSDAGVKTSAHQLGALVALGLSNSVDLVLGQTQLRIATTSAEASATARGAGDFSLDLKWRFYQSGGTSLALKPGFTAPTGDETRGLGAGKATYGLFFVGSFERSPWTLHTHAGYKAYRNRLEKPVDVLHLSVAAVYDATSRVRLAADVALDTDFGLNTTRQPAWLVLGAICSLGERVDLDLGWKRGLNGVAEDDAVLIGITTRW